MNKKKCLIVLINDFPFNNGEPFFEKEISFLSLKFDDILLFSVNGQKNEKPTRTVGKNVNVFSLKCSHNRFKYIVRGIFSRKKMFNTKNIHGRKKITAFYLNGKNISIANNVIKQLADINIDEAEFYVYSYWLTLGVSACTIKKFLESKLKRPIRVISRCHGYDIYSELHPFNFQPFQKEVIETMDAVYPCSTYGANYLKEKYPAQKEKIITARLFSEDHGIISFDYEKEMPKKFVSVSGFRPVKRLSLFAEAFSILAKKRNDVVWEAIGDGEEFEKVKKIISDSGVFDKVTFYGNKSNFEIYNYYSKNPVYFYINTSVSEGISVSIMEAISFGTPVIATDVGGTREIVGDDNGFLINADITKEEFSHFLEKCLSIDKKHYLKLRYNSRKKWEKLYNSSVNLDEWLKCIVGD